MVIFLLVAAFFQAPGMRRAVILFLVTYCLVASFTEDAFEAPSAYLLHLVIAASLLSVPRPGHTEELDNLAFQR
jgi:hypothetical protein